VTEELWDQFGYGPDYSLIRAEWPTPFAVPGAAEARAELDWVVRLIGEVRAVRAEMNVPPSVLGPILLKDASAETLERGARWMEPIGRMSRASSFGPLDGEIEKGSAVAVLDEATIVLPLAGLIDLAAEAVRLRKDLGKAGKEVEAADKKLSNADFVARAKEEVVDEIRERLAAAQADVARLQAALARIE